jgi:hypothetical protein
MCLRKLSIYEGVLTYRDNCNNSYYLHSRISEAKFRQFVGCFSLGFTVTSSAELIKLSLRSVNTIYLKIRSRTQMKSSATCHCLYNVVAKMKLMLIEIFFT